MGDRVESITYAFLLLSTPLPSYPDVQLGSHRDSVIDYFIIVSN